MTNLIYNVEEMDQWHEGLDRAYIVRLIVIGRCHGEPDGINMHLEALSLRHCELDKDEAEVLFRWGSRFDNDCARAQRSVPRTRLLEDAAVGVAGVLFPNIVKGTFLNVALFGQSFDYFVNTESGQYGLEISGTEQQGNLDTVHKTKIKQLLRNNSGKDGFVVVCGFRDKKVIMSFHLYEERTSA